MINVVDDFVTEFYLFFSDAKIVGLFLLLLFVSCISVRVLFLKSDMFGTLHMQSLYSTYSMNGCNKSVRFAIQSFV